MEYIVFSEMVFLNKEICKKIDFCSETLETFEYV